MKAAAIAKEYFVLKTREIEVIYERLSDAELLDKRKTLSNSNKSSVNRLMNHGVPEKELGIVISEHDRKEILW